ncbi:MAG: hypothetical protein PVH65_02190 [Chloroflexota bacterium]|jgi:hypothetical protein
MEYGKIISRAANLVWQNKFLILVGILAGLGSGMFNGGGGGGGAGGGGNGTGSTPSLGENEVGLIVGIGLAVLCVVVVIAIVIWVVSTVARGGLIASVDDIESGQKSSFRQAWSAGWEKVWTLLGIGILPAIPTFILGLVSLLGALSYGGLLALLGEDFEEVAIAVGASLGTGLLIVFCCIAPVGIVLSILRNFAERACMLEGHGVVDSYRRGANVLMANLGEALVLILIQVGLFIVLGILLFLPGLLALLCCILWPLLLALQGFTEAFQSALWTLAWRTWTGRGSMMEKAPVA